MPQMVALIFIKVWCPIGQEWWCLDQSIYLMHLLTLFAISHVRPVAKDMDTALRSLWNFLHILTQGSSTLTFLTRSGDQFTLWGHTVSAMNIKPIIWFPSKIPLTHHDMTLCLMGALSARDHTRHSLSINWCDIGSVWSGSLSHSFLFLCPKRTHSLEEESVPPARSLACTEYNARRRTF